MRHRSLRVLMASRLTVDAGTGLAAGGGRRTSDLRLGLPAEASLASLCEAEDPSKSRATIPHLSRQVVQPVCSPGDLLEHLRFYGNYDTRSSSYRSSSLTLEAALH